MSKIKLSIFKEDATDKFLENLQSIYSLGSQIDIEERKNLFTEINPEDKTFCEEISNIQLDTNMKFTNRFEFGKYLHSKIKTHFEDSKEKSRCINNPHFWSWIVLVYIEQLSNNYKEVRRPDRYIPALNKYKIYGSFNTSHRHMARESYRLYERFGEDSKIYFNKKNLYETGNIIESIRSRQDTSNHKGIHDYLLLKYKDLDGFAKAGAAETVQFKNRNKKITGRESTVRLAKIYRRLNINFVGPLLSAHEIAEKVGPGFEL